MYLDYYKLNIMNGKVRLFSKVDSLFTRGKKNKENLQTKWNHNQQRINLKWSLLLALLLSVTSLHAQRHMENLGRGLIAVRTSSNEVFISWRMLGSDPADVAFNLYRGDTKLNVSPIIKTTTFTDNTSTDNIYKVRPIINGNEQKASAPASVWKNSYKSIPLQRPAGGTTPDGISYTYSPNDLSVGDLDGDGEYEIVVKWNPSNAKDNSHSGYTGNVFIDAYEMDGTNLWRIDMGVNIRAGAHYTQFIVYDLDSDGKAEVAMKTADGTKDGTGVVIGDASADYRNDKGRILDGPEFLTIFNGQTGSAIATTDYLPARGKVESWGDDYGNRVDRFLAGVGYFDGERPSLLMTRGYYTRTVLVAWDWRNGQLTQRWVFDSDESGKAWAGQGNHNLSIADVDQDGKDEIIFGSMTIDDDGTGLYTSELGHGDAMHVSDLNPDRPGLEIWTAHEESGEYEGNGLWLRDAITGERIFGVPATDDVGRAMAADIDPRYKGYEVWGSSGNLYSITGTEIGTSRPSMNFGNWWDGDLQRELLDGTIISKWNYTAGQQETLLNAGVFGAVRNNGTKANPGLSADILGDWREEVIYSHNNGSELLLFTTTIPTNHRFYTFMHDPQYRLSVAWQNVAYNQPPHTSFYVGKGMTMPPDPSILLVDKNSQEASVGIKLPALLSDNMVLQQKTEANLWGWAGPGEEVEINGSWNLEKVVKVKANAKGEWKTSIQTSEAGGPYTLSFKGKNFIQLQNVFLGEVWLCSGQSNMHFPVAPIENSGWATGVVNYKKEIANADYPEIRMFTVERKVADEPQKDVDGERGWEVSSPSTVGNFSAVAYFFGRELHKQTGFPIGLINTSWGGTPAESWTQKKVLESERDFRAILKKYQAAVAEYPEAFKIYEKELDQWKEEAEEAKMRGEKPTRAPKEPIGPDHNKSPYKLYNAMVAPLHLYTIKGAIWYQGESNADRAYQYRKLFPAMIHNWREGWGTNFPFYFAQIAPQRIMNPEIREAQLYTMLSVPKTGMAVLTDAGDSLDIHPKEKQIVGKRLALWALAKDYGQQIVYSGPVYKSMKVQGNNIILKFDHTDGGLVAKGGPLTEFTIAGKDQQFLPAKAKIQGKTIVVWSDEVRNPVAVRFAWRNVPAPNLYNVSGLPASPFRTDDWPEKTEGRVWFK